ncbi:MAG: hypothetical protein Kow0056_14400 [Coriobacteriia bacterium]
MAKNASGKSKSSSNLPLVIVLVVAVVLAGLILLSRMMQPYGAGSITAIDNQQLRDLVADGALLVDVRTQQEYDSGHIEGAILAPVDSIATVAEGWDRDVPVVIYCATGARSSDAAKVLESMGFDVYDLTAGLVAWDGPLTTEATVQTPTTTATSGLPVMIEFLTDS